MDFFKRWKTFIAERFEPVSNTITLLFIFISNGLIAINGDPFKQNFDYTRLIPGFILFWLVFFHMRLFDEIKDYETDKIFNPGRPLPRKLIGLNEYGRVTLLIICLEVFIASFLGENVLFSYLCLLAFTLIMRQEFFIGDWLRPKMEAYAITHTFSAYLAGMLVYSIYADEKFIYAPTGYLVPVLSNWFVFNVYEFGRKTYGRGEKDEVENYSKRHGPFGAVLLLYFNVAAAFLFLSFYGLFIINLIVSLLLIIPCILYVKKPDASGSKIYRYSVTAYLGLFYASVILEIILGYNS